jgi:anion-transporting  ArsA/GET3 family ATPase
MTELRSDLAEILGGQKLVVCVGPGGVGKTTVAAAMGLHAATLGRRVLVLTIDPAKRLADALGLDGLDDRIREISTAPLADLGVEVSGSLHAAMFDNAVSMDSLMHRISPDPEARDRILSNRVYRAMAGSLARSHAYLAMERLHEVMGTGEYDLVILDTPPARNALDILDAPGRLASFLEEGVVKWFVRGKEAKGIRGRILQTGGAAATKLFSVIAGEQFLGEVMAFFEAFYDLRHGFRERAGRIQEIVRDPSASFILVSSTDETHLGDAHALGAGVVGRGIDLDAIVFNRSYEILSADPLEIVTEVRPRDSDETARELWPEGPPAGASQLLDRLAELRNRAAAANQRGVQAADSLVHTLGLRGARVHIARVEGEISDLMGLEDLRAYFAGRSSES